MLQVSASQIRALLHALLLAPLERQIQSWSVSELLFFKATLHKVEADCMHTHISLAPDNEGLNNSLLLPDAEISVAGGSASGCGATQRPSPQRAELADGKRALY